jgi:starch synthase
VSPGYAREITTPRFGCDLDGVLREHSNKLTGILNGIDPVLWNPASDRSIASNYSPGSMDGKKNCKQTLCTELGVEFSHGSPLLGMVTRLTSQKGIDLVISEIDKLMEMNFRLVVLGTGEGWAEKALAEAAEKYPGKISLTVAYNDRLARRIFAGADAFLMPSVFEPCGLGQMMAMRYGTVPLVRSVGGLSDSVSGDTGFLFSGGGKDFMAAAQRLLKTWKNRRRWAWFRRRCMKADFSWENRIPDYLEVYRKALEV